MIEKYYKFENELKDLREDFEEWKELSKRL